MKLYGSSLSPFVRKVLVFAAEKGIELELRPVAPGQPDPEFLAISPFGKIPGFRDGDFAISDSTAIVTYLEAKHPEPALIPAEPEARARAIWFEEFVDTILVPAGAKVFFNRIVAQLIGREPDLAAVDKAPAEEMPPLYRYLEDVLPEQGWLVGDRLTIADVSVGCVFANMLHARAPVDAAAYPKLAAYVSRWFERPSLKTWLERERAFLGGSR